MSEEHKQKCNRKASEQSAKWRRCRVEVLTGSNSESVLAAAKSAASAKVVLSALQKVDKAATHAAIAR